MEHGSEFTIILIFTCILAIGAATRVLTRLTSFPYTIAMMLSGIICGIVLQNGSSQEGVSGLFQMPADGMVISPGLIIFVFLPALLFESSYDLDGHLFRKNLSAITVLAGPAMLACTFLTAALMMWLTPDEWHWNWVTALTFGALISATDPVAVVAIMKEVGAPKRLGTLIEGESLLNDGTAIVVFSVLVGMLTMDGQTLDPGAIVLRFVTVVAGGLLTGVVLSFVISQWIGRTFNDPLVEITLTVVLGYLGMLVAEGMLHVSGVMAIVVAGLWMGGPGRTRISPEVNEFLHRFWRLLAYIANTIIFFLVGLIVATQVSRVAGPELICILVGYAGIMVIRLFVNFGARPVFSMLRNPVNVADSLVLTWGGLRGAVSLALALIIASNESIPAPLRQQILVLTVGVVVLTIMINGTTVGLLLRTLGLTKAPLPLMLNTHGARLKVLEDVQNRVDAAAASPGMRGINWGHVKRQLGERHEEEQRELDRLQEELRQSGPESRLARGWHEALNLERRAYWDFFAMGILGPRPVMILNREIESQLDDVDRGVFAPPKSRTPRFEGRLERWIRKCARSLNLTSMQYDYLRLLYALNRAENMAAIAVMKGLHGIKGVDEDVRTTLLDVYREYLSESNRRIEELRYGLPEITTAIEDTLARRVALNYERDGYDQLLHQGLVDASTAVTETERIETAMKELIHSSRQRVTPTVAQLLGEVPMFRLCSPADLEELAGLMEETLVPTNELLFREGDQGDSMFILVRGGVEVTKQHDGEESLLSVLGGGDIIGEMSLLSGELRSASARAVTPATLLRISASALDRFTELHPELRDEIWRAYCQHLLSNTLRSDAFFSAVPAEVRRSLELSARHAHLEPEQTAGAEEGETWLFIATGRLKTDDSEHGPGSLLDLRACSELTAAEDSHLLWLATQAIAP